MKNKKNPKYVASLSLFTGSILFCLILSEIILRVAGFSYQLYPEKIEFGWPDPITMQNVFLPDQDLFWVPKRYFYKLQETHARNPRVIYMGDSCTEFGRYDEYLKEIIDDQYPGNNYTYANFGVTGWSTYQGLQQLKRDVVKIKPKVITIYFGWNDHWIGFGIQDKDIAEMNSSLLFKLRKFRLVQLIDKAYIASIHGYEKDQNPERVPIEEFRSNLIEMIQIARDNDIIPVLLTAPTSHIKGKEPAYFKKRWLRQLSDLVPLHRRYISTVRDIAKEKNVILVDLAEYFDSLPKASVAREYFMEDGIHLTDKGNKQLAQCLFQGLRDSGLLEKLI